MTNSSQPTKMNIFIDIDNLSITSNELVWGRIYLTIEGEPFPNSQWDDFVVNIMGAWLDEMLFNKKHDIVLTFIDGPYHIILKSPSKDNLWTVDCVARFADEDRVIKRYSIVLEDFLPHLLDVSLAIVQKCDGNGWKTPHIKSLRKLCKRLAKKLDRT